MADALTGPDHAKVLAVAARVRVLFPEGTGWVGAGHVPRVLNLIFKDVCVYLYPTSADDDWPSLLEKRATELLNYLLAVDRRELDDAGLKKLLAAARLTMKPPTGEDTDG